MTGTDVVTPSNISFPFPSQNNSRGSLQTQPHKLGTHDPPSSPAQKKNFANISLDKIIALPFEKAEEEQKEIDPGNGRNRTAVGSALLDFNLHNDTCYHYTTSP
jgi:hypothetical protein